jgi:hypothetical protein
MIGIHRRFWTTAHRLGCAGLLALAAAGAAAQDELPECPPGEDAVTRAYAPTAAKMKALTEAYEALAVLVAKDRGLAATLEDDKKTGGCRVDGSTQPSIAGMQRMFSKLPQVGSVFSSRGIAPREVVIWALLSLHLVALAGPDPSAAPKVEMPPAMLEAMRAAAKEELSPAQQAFARDNGAGLRRLFQAQRKASGR